MYLDAVVMLYWAELRLGFQAFEEMPLADRMPKMCSGNSNSEMSLVLKTDLIFNVLKQRIKIDTCKYIIMGLLPANRFIAGSTKDFS